MNVDYVLIMGIIKLTWILLSIIECVAIIPLELTRTWNRYIFLPFLVSVIQQSKKKNKNKKNLSDSCGILINVELA